jgi:hypothetical protein
LLRRRSFSEAGDNFLLQKWRQVRVAREASGLLHWRAGFS